MTQSFKLLRELLSHLSNKELALLRKRVSAGQDEPEGRNRKSLLLVDLLIKDRFITASQAGLKIYGIINKSAYSKLIDRIIDRIDEIFITFSKDSSLFHSERNYYYFSLKKKLLIVQMRFLRGIEFGIEWQFEKILSLSKKYELYEILIDALYIKQRFILDFHKKKEINDIQKQIDKYEAIKQKVQLSRIIWTRFSAKLNQANSQRDYQDELEITIDKMWLDFAETNSPTIKYYCLFLRVELLQINYKYFEAEKVLNEILQLLIKNVSVYTKIRMGDVLINLATNQILLNDFVSSKSNVEQAMQFVEVDTSSYLLFKETEFLIKFYSGEIDKAEKIIEAIFEKSFSRNIPSHLSKRAYFYACIKTIKGEIDMSNELLSNTKELDKNKGEWNISKRILSIINCIESGEQEKADLQVMNLEKFIKRNSKLHHFRKREKLIVRILINLLNEGFDFNMVYKNRKRYFDLLESDDPDYRWKIKSPELIVFTQWFKKKMRESA